MDASIVVALIGAGVSLIGTGATLSLGLVTAYVGLEVARLKSEQRETRLAVDGVHTVVNSRTDALLLELKQVRAENNQLVGAAAQRADDADKE